MLESTVAPERPPAAPPTPAIVTFRPRPPGDSGGPSTETKKVLIPNVATPPKLLFEVSQHSLRTLIAMSATSTNRNSPTSRSSAEVSRITHSFTCHAEGSRKMDGSGGVWACPNLWGVMAPGAS
ncbi:hypothetical protein N7G274_006239 [Stereocaulon virgatum]|uniref:Uncharacterized protein n=1 Tax=Stereocaulon virgatum TaxID=373712 RepID=A0ABR4A5Z2_9LECA